jgi:hypothetical protein
MKHVKLFEQFVNEKEELYTAYIEDGREPGGTDKEIKKDYNLEVTNRTKDGFDVTGAKQDVEDFIEEYGIISDVTPVNEYQEPIFQIDLKDLKVGDKLEWYGGEGNYRKLRATGVVKKIKSGAVEITDLEKVGTKVMALMGTVIDDKTRLFRVGPGGKLNNWRLVESVVNEDKFKDALWNMEDWMPDDMELQDEYYELLGAEDIDGLTSFFDEFADGDALQQYGIKYQDLKKLAKTAINQQ